ncbi:MAG: H-type small acid-soluble spore protein [Lachnospiraceae bacterium]|jgi:H-type small acid-soluble spore protein|nr:H-type small acid-soluble spore protein [Lachnospiraceae bacterium]
MDRRRASEIISSLEMADVTYNGRLIYIEEINPAKDSASVHYLDQPHYSQEVPLTHLVEAVK